MDTKQLKQRILDLAIRGKLVPQDPNDEPASVLLKRIRTEKEQLIAQGKLKKSKTKSSDKPHYGNVPFEIPESWEWCRLDELCSIKGGKRIPKGKNFSILPTKHIYIRVTDMKKNTILDNELHYIDEEVFTEICKYTISKDDLYLTIAGTIGAVGEVPKLFDGMNLTENAAKLTHIQCNKKYLMYALLSTSSQEHFKSRYHQVAQPKLSIETAASTPITFPPLAEQQRIVAEVEKWFALIDEVEVNKEELKEYILQVKAKVLDLAIHGKLVPQDPNDEPAIELLKRINPNFKPCDTSHYENLPAGWSVVQLCDIAKTVTGSTPSKNNKSYYGGTFPLYKPSDLDAGRNVNEASEYLSEEGKRISRIIPANSIAVCCIGSIGKCGYIMREGTTNQQINTIIPLYNIYPLYIYYFCLSASFVQQLLEKSSAVTIAIVNKSKLDSTFILLPPLAEQKRIAEQIETIFASLDTITAEL